MEAREQLNKEDLTRRMADLTPEQRSLLMVWLQKEQRQRGETNRLPSVQLPLVGIHTTGTKPAFFCVHSYGGGTFYYIDLSRALDDDQPFYALQAAGFSDDREPHTSIEAMAAYYIEAIRGVQPQGPYYLGGWCFGGLIAFEMAHQLKKQGDEIALVALMDTANAPVEARSDTISAIRVFLGIASTALGEWPEISVERLEASNEEQQLDYLAEVLKQLGQKKLQRIHLNIGFEQSILQKMIRIIKSNAQAIQNYSPPVVPIKVTYFQSTEPTDEKTPTETYDTFWREHTYGMLDLHRIPGQHMSMVQKPFVEELAKKLRECIELAYETQKRRDVQP